jgi:hypothetical protein
MENMASVVNPSAWQFKFRCCLSPTVLFSARHLNSDRELLYSSLFLKYMRYKHETFTNDFRRWYYKLSFCSVSEQWKQLN